MPDWVFDPIIGEIVQLLQDENLELEHYINRLGTSAALALATVHDRN